MNDNDDNCATPKNRKVRSLGLRKYASMSCGNNALAVNNQGPKEQTTNVEVSTPVSSVSAANRLRTASTNCRPYRLSLSKEVRDKLTKKRLEFHLANANAAEGETHALPAPTASNEVEPCIEDNATKVQQEQESPDEEKKHAAKVLELKTEIEMWKSAFAASLDELQQTQNIEPKMDKAELLQQLQIPPEMIKYLNE